MLLTLAQLQSYKSITANIDQAKHLEPYIQEAEEFDLRPFLGDELYTLVVADHDASPSLATYGDLFNGSTYTYGGRTYKHEGLKAVLAYFTYARYLANANNHSTRAGITVKKSEFSEPASEKTIMRLVDQARSGALTYQSRVEDFIRRHAATYPEWRGNAKRTSKIRISGVGGNSTYKNKNRGYGSLEEYCENEE
jgi:hypothetical protein